MSRKSDRCAICGGPPEDHKNSRHVFTTDPGDLRPPEKQQPQRPQIVAMPTQEPVATALINLLLDKELITQGEALACFGVPRKPATSSGEQQARQSSGYADPAVVRPQ